MITVRPYEKRDLSDIRELCFGNSWLAEKPSHTNREVVFAMYCDYYLEQESEFCFVALDDDVPVGYLLCSADAGNYYEQLTENYLPLVRKISGSDYFQFAAEVKMQQRYFRQGYTSHFHVVVAQEYRRQGIGTQLVEAMLAKLQEVCAEGVFVVCGLKDQQAKDFCQKVGFEDIDYLSGCVVFGKKLFDASAE